MKIITSKIVNFRIVGLISIKFVEAKEIVAEIKIVTIKIVTTQRIVLLRSFFSADGSDLDTMSISFSKIITVADRINLTA